MKLSFVFAFSILALFSLSVLVSSQQSNLTGYGAGPLTGGALAGPDLIISDVQAWQVTATDLKIVFTVENIGNEDAVASGTVSIINFVYGSLSDSVSGAFSIKAGDKQDFDIVVPYDSTAVDIEASVDPNDDVQNELDETNNAYKYTFSSATPTTAPLPPIQPLPPANLVPGWNIDQNGDGWLVIDFEPGFNLVGNLMSLVSTAVNPTSTIDLTKDLDVIYALDPVKQQLVECYPGVNAQQQTKECTDFSNRISQDPAYIPYISSIGGLGKSAKSGQIVLYMPSYIVQQLKDPAVLQQAFSQISLADGWNVLFVGPWFEGLSLNDVKGTCNFGDIYGWDASTQSWVGPSTIPLTQPFSPTAVGRSILVEVNGDCSLSYGAGGRPTLPPRSGGVASPTTTAQPTGTVQPTQPPSGQITCTIEKSTGCYRCSNNPNACYSQAQAQNLMSTAPTKAPDLLVSASGIAVSKVSIGSLKVIFDILNNGNLDTEVPDINLNYAGKVIFIDGTQAKIIAGSGSSPTAGPRTISPGGVKSIEYTVAFDPTSKTVTVVLDPLGKVVETDETNNIQAYKVTGLPGDSCTSSSDCLSYYCNYNTPRTCN